MGGAVVALYQKKTERRQMSKKENMVVASVVRWWVGRRPCEWSHAEHMNNPVVNCSTKKECHMAKAVKKYLDGAPNANQLLKDADQE